jgi:hypothetical protein
MNGMYWYVSRQKTEALRDRYDRSPGNWLDKLSVTIKAPFVEAQAAMALDKTLFEEVERIEKNLLKSGAVQEFANIAKAHPTAFFLFNGAAHRTIQQGGYWIAMVSGSTALLLGGSASNAIGAPPKETAEISPSANPIGSFNSVFADQMTDRNRSSISENCSYVWAAIAEQVRDAWGGLPRVEGIAVYGGRFPASKTQMQSSGFERVQEVIVGSPIFVRQL